MIETYTKYMNYVGLPKNGVNRLVVETSVKGAGTRAGGGGSRVVGVILKVR